VVQRLVRRLHPAWLYPRCHRLNAFAITRQQQSRAIRMKRHRPVGMTKRRT